MSAFPVSRAQAPSAADGGTLRPAGEHGDKRRVLQWFREL
jgi:hypothetical protein